MSHNYTIKFSEEDSSFYDTIILPKFLAETNRIQAYNPNATQSTTPDHHDNSWYTPNLQNATKPAIWLPTHLTFIYQEKLKSY